jgi:hypothetical protein
VPNSLVFFDVPIVENRNRNNENEDILNEVLRLQLGKCLFTDHDAFSSTSLDYAKAFYSKLFELVTNTIIHMQINSVHVNY